MMIVMIVLELHMVIAGTVNVAVSLEVMMVMTVMTVLEMHMVKLH